MENFQGGRFQGPKIWNDLDEHLKTLSRDTFKKNIINNIIESY